MEDKLYERLPFVSVVIPTLNWKNCLEPCLRSLSNMDYTKQRIEINLEDGDSSEGTIYLADFPDASAKPSTK